jgi:two-component system sensor histidine kinase CreC
MVTIRARLLFAFAALVAAGLLVMARLVLSDVRPHTFGATEDSLAETAVLLASLVEADSAGGALQLDRLRATVEGAAQRPLDARIYDLHKRAVELRVYVTDARGIVVFDSDGGQAVGRDYSRWRDVKQALERGYGARASRRDPKDPYSSVFYVAVPVRRGDQVAGVLAVGKQARDVKQLVASLDRKVGLAGLLALAAATAAALLLTAWITRPLSRLAGYARAVAGGQRPPLPPLETREVLELGRDFETMRMALEGRRDVEGYVRSLTHETKAPLAAIRASAELLHEGLPLDAQRRFLENILTETERLQQLVDRILELSALEARSSLDRVEAVDLGALGREVALSVEPLARERGLRVSADTGAAGQVPGDPLLLRQALLNLVHNALRWTPRGGQVEIVGRRTPQAIELQVLDTGSGVPDYGLPRVFEKFYSLAPPGEPRSTGLGLPFVREVLALHGGTVRVENRAEGGARATLSLPLVGA